MNLTRIYAVFLRQIFLLKKSPSRLTGIFYWPIIDIFLWGVFSTYLTQSSGNKVNLLTIILGALILWNFLVRVQHGITTSFLEDVWSRNFINFFASPLSLNEYIAGLMATSVLTCIISMVSLVAFAWLLFSYNVFTLGFMLIPFVAILFFSGWAFGILVTAIILRYGPSIEILAWSLSALLSPLSGVFYPVSALPFYLQPIAKILPPTYVFEGMRKVMQTGVFDWQIFSIGLVLAAVFFFAAYFFLVLTYRRVLRLGLITRFLTD